MISNMGNTLVVREGLEFPGVAYVTPRKNEGVGGFAIQFGLTDRDEFVADAMGSQSLRRWLEV